MASDLISREALLDFAHNHINGTIDCNDIARFPGVDAVEVVRCKDCIFYQPYIQEMYEGKGDCEEHDAMVCDDDFCSYGTKG